MSVQNLQVVDELTRASQTLVRGVLDAKCFISRLPPKLLGQVFYLVPGRLPIDGTSCSRARRTYDLVPLTHVCRCWRDIAFSISSLWQTICETSRAHTAWHVLRARARQTPLIIYVDRPQASLALSDILASDGHAVTELHLRGLQEEPAARLASDLLAFPAPHLRHATVSIRRKPGAPSHSAAGLEPLVEFWSGTAPNLKTLELHDVPLLPSNYFGSLARLQLSFDLVPFEWTLCDLLRVIQRSPVLEYVSLRGLPSDLHLRHSC
ncbi:hypothetical protein OH77DRAFT_938427 [Trametes cingulata]|nr:hypothetical protein OH77DRAFT_938427 [Trametes cingulata]